MSRNRHYDLLIIGSGSTAAAAAHEARRMNKSVLIAEERIVGGACLNFGCMPSKFLIEAAKIHYFNKHPKYQGFGPSKKKFDFSQLIEQKNEMILSYRKGKRKSILSDDIEIAKGHAKLIDAHTVEIHAERVTASKILIASGSRPDIPEIDGLDQTPYLTSDLLTTQQAIALKEVPSSLIILGGGYIALELGQMFNRFGSKVTIIEKSKQVLSEGYEPEVGECITRLLQDEGMEFICSAEISRVRPRSRGVAASVKTAIGQREFMASAFLIAAGRRPNTDEIGLAEIGVALTNKAEIKVDRHLRTSVSDIFAAGDVIGGEQGSQMATPVGVKDGIVAVHNAFSDPFSYVSVNHRVIPRTIFTDPEIATVGVTESRARQAGLDVSSTLIKMEDVPRAVTVQQTGGIAKIVFDKKTDEVLGVTMIGHSAGEVIHEAAMAMHFHARVRDFVEMIHVYPSMAEALRIVADNV